MPYEKPIARDLNVSTAHAAYPCLYDHLRSAGGTLGEPAAARLSQHRLCVQPAEGDRQEQPTRNVFISPYSVSTVLQMVCNGAGGKTKEELQQVLGTTGLTLAAMNQANQNLSQAIRSGSSNVVLNSANAIWYRKGMPVRPEFLACNKQFYRRRWTASISTTRLRSAIMNAWVNEMTRGRIPSIVTGPIDPHTYLYLANAVYFKGGWFSSL